MLSFVYFAFFPLAICSVLLTHWHHRGSGGARAPKRSRKSLFLPFSPSLGGRNSSSILLFVPVLSVRVAALTRVHDTCAAANKSQPARSHQNIFVFWWETGRCGGKQRLQRKVEQEE